MDIAAAKYLDELRKNITNETMEKIISAKGDSTLIFVIDTTGSMGDEINAAKAIAKQIINTERDYEVDYILSPFNDPSKIYICTGKFSFYATPFLSRLLMFKLNSRALALSLNNTPESH